MTDIDKAYRQLKRELPVGTVCWVEHEMKAHIGGDSKRLDELFTVYVEGGYWFRARTLTEAIKKYRAWKDKESIATRLPAFRKGA